jgi:hypothetical protein
MAKEPKEPLLESLEQDIAQLEKEKDNGQVQSGSETDGKLSEQESGSDNGARKRVSSRRSARKSARDTQSDGGAPREGSGEARGSLGDTPGSGEVKPQDVEASLGDGGTPSGSGENGDVLEKPLSPKEEAYHRRIARENAAEIKELKNQLAALSKPPVAELAKPAETPKPELKESLDQWRSRNPEPDREKDLAGWLVWSAEDGRKWREEQNASNAKSQQEKQYDTLVQSAKQEIEQIQSSYRKTNPDYDNALTHAKNEYSKAVKTLMPQLTEAQIGQALDKEIFNLALKCNKEGTNLGEVLYDMAIERFGYDSENVKPVARPGLRPSLRVVADNKKRAPSPLAGGGEGAKPRVSMEQASQMSPQELMDLDATDWEYLNSQGFN